MKDKDVWTSYHLSIRREWNPLKRDPNFDTVTLLRFLSHPFTKAQHYQKFTQSSSLELWENWAEAPVKSIHPKSVKENDERRKETERSLLGIWRDFCSKSHRSLSGRTLQIFFRRYFFFPIYSPHAKISNIMFIHSIWNRRFDFHLTV